MIGEEGVPLHIVEVTGLGVRELGRRARDVLPRIQAEHLVKPLFYRVPVDETQNVLPDILVVIQVGGSEVM